jgi:hypothetical protein
MKTGVTPSIHSFIIRLVVEDTPSEAGKQTFYHGAVRHIQSAEEVSFHEWSEAVEFMCRYASLEDPNKKPDPIPHENQP